VICPRFGGLAGLQIEQIVIVGGVNAVSRRVQNALTDDYTVRRVSGPDRVATAAAVREWGVARGMSASRVALVRSDVFADALSAGAVAGSTSTPLLYTASNRLPALTTEILSTLRTDLQRVEIFGGPTAISTTVETAVRELLTGTNEGSLPPPGPGGGGGGGGGIETGFPVVELLSVELQQGTGSTLIAPGIESLTIIAVTPATNGVGVVPTANEPGTTFLIEAASDAVLGQNFFEVQGVGCVDIECGEYVLTINVMIAAPGVVETADLTVASPSADRLARAEPTIAGLSLTDEITVVLGTSNEPGGRSDASAMAQLVGGVVIGGIEGLGIFQILVPPGTVEAAIAVLETVPGVAGAAVSVVGGVNVDVSPPGDWDDGVPSTASDESWPFEQIRAPQAWALMGWDQARGGTSSAPVAIVDGGPVWSYHPDLNVVSVDPYIGYDTNHATHVAGLACARANGVGVVGAAWGCPIVSTGVPERYPLEDGSLPTEPTYSFLDIYAAVDRAMSQTPRPKVVNISMGPSGNPCATSQQTSDLVAAVERQLAGPARRTVERYPDVIFTLSAGNSCAKNSAQVFPPSVLHEANNVIVVASTNRDGILSRYSNWGDGVDVAAPGEGVWSSWYGLGLVRYQLNSGTSMAAPVVAGVAALVRQANPTLPVAKAVACITETAGTNTGVVVERSNVPAEYSPFVDYTGAVPIVDAEAAVKCALNGGVNGDGGAGLVWERASTLGLGESVQLIDCPTDSVCFAVNEQLLLKSTDSGATWSDITGNLGGNVGGIFSLSCPSIDTCLIGVVAENRDRRLLRSTNGGLAWADVWSAEGDIYGADCFDTTNCIAVGSISGSTGLESAVFRTQNGGGTWQTITLPTGYYITLASRSGAWFPKTECVSASRCFLAATVSDYETYVHSEIIQLDGTNWTLGLLKVESTGFSSISCGSSTACVAVTDGNGLGLSFGTQDGGSTWTQIALPGSVNGLADVSCGSANSCLIVGGASTQAAFRLSPDGTNVSRQDLNPAPTAVSCASGSRCQAISTAGSSVGYSTMDSGATWVSRALPRGLTGIVSFDCWQAGGCAALDESGQLVVLNFDGNEMRRTAVDQSPSAWAYDVTCPDEVRCLVVGNWGMSRTDDAGVSWSRVLTFEDVNDLVEDSQLTSIDCGARDRCLALVKAFDTGETTAILSSDGGTTWIVGGALGVDSGFSVGNNLDCPTALLCWATFQRSTDDALVIVRTEDGGQSWRVVHVAPTTQRVKLSCTMSSFCMAVLWQSGHNVVLTSTDGNSWDLASTPEEVSGYVLPWAVTCMSPRSCRIVTGDRVWRTTDGVSWSAEQITDNGYSFDLPGGDTFVGYTIDGNGLIVGRTAAFNPIVLRTVSQR
jgi:subtilisin family serine protease